MSLSSHIEDDGALANLVCHDEEGRGGVDGTLCDCAVAIVMYLGRKTGDKNITVGEDDVYIHKYQDAGWLVTRHREDPL
jgi:hypothetical protein